MILACPERKGGVVAAILILLALTILPARVFGQPPTQDPPARQILKEAMANDQDFSVLEACLAKIEAEIKERPGSGLNFYVQGWILARLIRPEEAVAAYDKAISLDPTLGDAAYNAGVILAGLGRDAEAEKHWEAAVAADPKNADALYNLGQMHYNRKEFIDAVVYWSRAREISPSDFDIAKKVLQAMNALCQPEATRKARENVFEIWRTSQDPQVRKLSEYVFDQFDVDRFHVYAYETFDPKGAFFSVYTFRVAGPDDKIIGAVQLESSQAIRDAGTPYILGLTVGAEHRTLDATFKELPDYGTLKPKVIKIIKDHFGSISRRPVAPL